MLRIIVNALRTGVVTTRYPAEPSLPPDRFRGLPVFHPGSDLPPPSVCPSGAISEHFDGGARQVELDVARCVFCGRCAEDPWAGAVTIGREFELAARTRGDLRIEVVADDATISSVGPAADPGTEAASASSEIRRVLGRSLHLRHLDAGSCNACDWELTALLNPVYDVRRLGIDFVASPRHADGVVVTGSVTRNLETAVRRTLDAIPLPRVVIAVGACAASGGIVGESYASAGGIDRVLPVDVYIPGCPPRPEAIIFGILVAIGRRDARRLSRAE
jgi:Ni,Fe-hydrogenase III small subunit/formate hydrogenlyase subunit 6/NADH:ubiquinone oxidoreductase subunit I